MKQATLPFGNAVALSSSSLSPSPGSPLPDDREGDITPPPPQQRYEEPSDPSNPDPNELGGKRPQRSSRTKAPVSYKEDLKAVLRADAKAEAALWKERNLKRAKEAAHGEATPTRQRKRDGAGASRAASFSSSSQQKPTPIATPLPQSQPPQSPQPQTLLTPQVQQPPPQQSHPPPQAAAQLSLLPPLRQPPASAPAPEESEDEVQIVASNLAPRAQATACSREANRSGLDESGTMPSSSSTPASASTPAGPMKPHPFFSKREKPKPTPKPVPVASAEAEPSTPYKDKGKGKAKALAPLPPMAATPPSWSLFSQRGGDASKTGGEAGKRSRTRTALEAPWPNREQVHVRNLFPEEVEALPHRDGGGATPPPSSSSSWAATAAKGKQRATEDQDDVSDYALLDWMIRRGRGRRRTAEVVSASDGPETLQETLHRLCPDHGAPIRRGKAGTGQHLLTDTYRPRSAAQCKGKANQDCAAYMRDWLRALLVQPTAPGGDAEKKRKRKESRKTKRTVLKRVNKTRAKRRTASDDEMHDFIVGDDEDEEAWFDQFRRVSPPSSSGSGGEEDDQDIDDVPSSSVLDAATALEPFKYSTRLTNCLVITGPNGSGKTAAVYACASELGYEVFELFPGMGRRSGKDLHNAVGDLIRNHMVSSGGVGGGAFFSASYSSASPSAAEGEGARSVRQSLILLEEADIVFQEDKGFWTAVVELLAVSQRPMIVTCNDLDFVPTADLPVQEVLRWTEPSEDEVGEVVQHLASSEGDGERKQAERGTMGVDRGPDLRQAICQFHFDLFGSGPAGGEAGEDQSDREEDGDLRRLAKRLDAASVLALVQEEDDEVEVQGDLLQLPPHMRYLTPSPVERRGTEASFSFVIEVEEEMQRLYPFSLDGLAQLPDQRQETFRQLDDLLHLLCLHSFHSTDAVLDYAPYVRSMAHFDEIQYQEYLALQSTAMGRSTRNSSRFLTNHLGPRGEYVRWLPFGPTERAAVKASAIC
ncbi:hypothetical protein ACQY0O_005312 [Thecaphora frezii]